MTKRIVPVIAAAVILTGVEPLYVLRGDCAETPEVSAKAAVLISADTGEIIFEQNSSEKLPMASTTKIMTTLLCIESGGLDEEFVVDSEAIKVEGSSMGLREGDKVTKYALCCGMLLPSGNDAANAVAVKVGGSTEGFVKLMNERAEQLGLSHTYFVTPSGLDGEGHGSSAYDMALLAMEALKNETFRSICSEKSIKVEFGAPPYPRWLKNTNKLLGMCDGVYGVKTGFTDAAGRCLVSACERDGERLICVTLNDRNDWNDHAALYDYGFEKADKLRLSPPELPALDIVGGETEKLKLRCDDADLEVTSLSRSGDGFTYRVVSPPFIYAPAGSDEEAAQLSISFGGREIKRIPLYAEESVAVKRVPAPKSGGSGRIGKFISGLRKLFF